MRYPDARIRYRTVLSSREQTPFSDVAARIWRDILYSGPDGAALDKKKQVYYFMARRGYLVDFDYFFGAFGYYQWHFLHDWSGLLLFGD